MTPLHAIGETIRHLMTAIPLPAVRAIFVLLLVALLIWVLQLPKSTTTPPGEGRTPLHWSENLKLWAAVALVFQIVIYLVF